MQLRECVNDLKSKLYTEVQNYEQLKNDLGCVYTKRDVLIEIITLLEDDSFNNLQLGLLLPIVYGNVEANSIHDKLVSILYSKDSTKINRFILSIKEKFKDDLQSFSNQIQLLKNELQIKKESTIEYRKILSNFKYLGLLSSDQIEIITEIMKKYNYDKKDQIRILEAVRFHNTRVKFEDKSKISYTVVNMLDDKYEKYEVSELEEADLKNKFQTAIDSFYRSIKMENSIEDIIELMPELESGSYSLEEYDYIYKKIINRIIDDLLENITSISDQDIYNDIELRKVVIQEYNENKFKFNKLEYFYKSRRLSYCSKIEQEKELNNSEESLNNIFYLLTSNGDISYLERDIKEFPEEYLLKVKQLIEGKKSNTLSIDWDKALTSHKVLRQYGELKYDQIRIMYKHLSNNNYLIVGAFVKKTNTDLKKYGTIASRIIDVDISTPELLADELENSGRVEDRLYKFIDDRSRKGSR